jgi:hypothetical protein
MTNSGSAQVGSGAGRRSVPALHLFEGVQTETVRLHFDPSASSESLVPRATPEQIMFYVEQEEEC